MQHTHTIARQSIATSRWIAPLLIISAVLLAPEVAQSQIPNLSDNTGNNVSDITGNNVSDITGNIVTDVLGIGFDETSFGAGAAARAQQLLTQLEQARTACEASKERAVEQPRRFARGPADPNESCLTAECEQYNQLMREARVFLSNVDRTQEQIRQRFQTAQLW